MDSPISDFLKVDYGNIARVIMGIISLAIGAYVFSRKTNLEEYTSRNLIHIDQTKSLLQQIEFLSEELTKARDQLTEIHRQNVELMEKLRQANKRIQDLELFIAVNFKIDRENCPDDIFRCLKRTE